MVEFKPWPKIGRINQKVCITEKMDGTNACIIIDEMEDTKQLYIVGVQSRKRLITPEDDNYGFAVWVYNNNEELLKLGQGYHYGEWVGEGINKNPHWLPTKQFYLFNCKRWGKHNPNTPTCCKVVPILYEGVAYPGVVEDVMNKLKADAIPEQEPEGIIIYYPSTNTMLKHTFKYQQGKHSGE